MEAIQTKLPGEGVASMRVFSRCRGAVAMEFLFLFPFVIAMLYASAVYGITFFAKYQMQDAVNRAVTSALYVDRSNALDDAGVKTAVETRAQEALGRLVEALPGWPGERSSLCQTEGGGGAAGESSEDRLVLIHCSLVYPAFRENPIVPTLNFGILGEFPPLPETLEVHARAAF